MDVRFGVPINQCRYQIRCRYYHTKWGCGRGNTCWYRHDIIPSPPAATLLGMNNIAEPSTVSQQVLEMVQKQMLLLQSMQQQLELQQQQITILVEKKPMVMGDFYYPPTTPPKSKPPPKAPPKPITISCGVNTTTEPSTTLITLNKDIEKIKKRIINKNSLDEKKLKEILNKIKLEYKNYNKIISGLKTTINNKEIKIRNNNKNKYYIIEKMVRNLLIVVL